MGGAADPKPRFYPREVVSAVYATATWLGGWLGCWLDVTRRYCIKTAKTILKRFRLSGRPIILVSSDPCADTKSKGNPFSLGYIYTGWEKLAIFDGNRRLSRKRCEIGRWLLWNRKSWVPDWTVSFSMTLSDPNPGFKVTVYTYKSKSSETMHF